MPRPIPAQDEHPTGQDNGPVRGEIRPHVLVMRAGEGGCQGRERARLKVVRGDDGVWGEMTGERDSEASIELLAFDVVPGQPFHGSCTRFERGTRKTVCDVSVNSASDEQGTRARRHV